jgi:Condensation domain.
MRQVANALVLRHEGLRTHFTLGEHGEPMQVVSPSIPDYFETLDLSSAPASQVEAVARQTILQRMAVPFDLAAPALHRLTWMRLGDDDHVLFWMMHHAICDNWSIALLMREALQIYSSELDEQPSTVLAPLTLGYADYATWQRSPESSAQRKPICSIGSFACRACPHFRCQSIIPGAIAKQVRWAVECRPI